MWRPAQGDSDWVSYWDAHRDGFLPEYKNAGFFPLAALDWISLSPNRSAPLLCAQRAERVSWGERLNFLFSATSSEKRLTVLRYISFIDRKELLVCEITVSRNPSKLKLHFSHAKQ